MSTFFSFQGFSSRSSFSLNLFIGFLVSAILYISFARFINPWALICVVTLIFVPSMIRRLRDRGFRWYWLLSLFICLIPLLLSVLILAYVLPDSLKQLGESLRILILLFSVIIPPALIASLAWLVIKRDFLRMWAILTPFTAPFWLLYQLIFAKSLQVDDQPSPQSEASGLSNSYKRIFFSLSGRLSRGELWLYAIIPFAFISIFVEGVYIPLMYMAKNVPALGYVISTLITLVLAVPSFTVLVKRLHDLNKSGWWLSLLLVPIFGLLYLIIVTSFYRGDDKANNFGERTGDADMNSVYQLGISKLESIVQYPGFKAFVIFSIGLISILLLRDIYSLFNYGSGDYNAFGLVGIIIESIFNVFHLICIVAICLFGINNIDRNTGFKLSLILLLALAVTNIAFCWQEWNYYGYGLAYIMKYLVAVVVVALTFIITGIKNIRSNVFTLGLAIALYAGSTMLSTLYNLYYGYTSWHYVILQQLAFFEIGLFLIFLERFMSADNNTGIESDDVSGLVENAE